MDAGCCNLLAPNLVLAQRGFQVGRHRHVLHLKRLGQPVVQFITHQQAVTLTRKPCMAV